MSFRSKQSPIMLLDVLSAHYIQFAPIITPVREITPAREITPVREIMPVREITPIRELKI